MWRGYCIKKSISSKLVCFRQYNHTAIVEAHLPVGKTKQIIRKCTIMVLNYQKEMGCEDNGSKETE